MLIFAETESWETWSKRTLRVVGDNWDEIIRYNCHVVAVEGEFLHSLGPGIDQSESVYLAWREPEIGIASVVCAFRLVTGSDGRTVENTLSVYQVVVR